MFFHGFASSAASSKVKLLEEVLPEFNIIAPDIPIDPNEALPFLKDLCQQEQPDIIVGKCMGGMYCQQMFGFKRICINPVFYMSKHHNLLRIGTGKYFNLRKNGDTHFIITPDIIAHFKEMEDYQFDGVTMWDRENVWALYIGDDLPYDSIRKFKKYYHNLRFYQGNQRIDISFCNSVLTPLILHLTWDIYQR